MAMVTSDNSLYCYHFDATGHTVALTNAGKTVVNKYAYTPFGVITGQTETIPQPFKYAGQHGVMAESNGFYYMRARYYDPAVKRFISEDPLGFDGGDLNLYAYCGNSPVMGVDPLGLCEQGLGYFSAAKRYMAGTGGSVTVDATALQLIKTGPNAGTIFGVNDYAVHGNVGLNNDGSIRYGDFNFDMKDPGYYGNTWRGEATRLIRNGATLVLEGATYTTGAAANFSELNFNLNPQPFTIKYSGKPNVIYDAN
jgi:RHS repeat-associated protein